MAAPARPSIESPFRRRGCPGCGARSGPIREARGFARAMLYVGAGITLFFVLIAILAPLISPYDFDQYQSRTASASRSSRRPRRDHLLGTTVQSTDVMSRVIWGAQTELKVVVLSLVFAIAVGCRSAFSRATSAASSTACSCCSWTPCTPFPYLLLAIVIAFLLSNSIGKGVLTAAIAITGGLPARSTSAWSATR